MRMMSLNKEKWLELSNKQEVVAFARDINSSLTVKVERWSQWVQVQLN